MQDPDYAEREQVQNSRRIAELRKVCVCVCMCVWMGGEMYVWVSECMRVYACARGLCVCECACACIGARACGCICVYVTMCVCDAGSRLH
jgi:hypothetical protein